MAMYKYKHYVTQEQFTAICNNGGLAIFADDDGVWTIYDGSKYIVDEDKAHEVVKI